MSTAFLTCAVRHVTRLSHPCIEACHQPVSTMHWGMSPACLTSRVRHVTRLSHPCGETCQQPVSSLQWEVPFVRQRRERPKSFWVLCGAHMSTWERERGWCRGEVRLAVAVVNTFVSSNCLDWQPILSSSWLPVTAPQSFLFIFFVFCETQPVSYMAFCIHDWRYLDSAYLRTMNSRNLVNCIMRWLITLKCCQAKTWQEFVSLWSDMVSFGYYLERRNNGVVWK